MTNLTLCKCFVPARGGCLRHRSTSTWRKPLRMGRGTPTASTPSLTRFSPRCALGLKSGKGRRRIGQHRDVRKAHTQSKRSERGSGNIGCHLVNPLVLAVQIGELLHEHYPNGFNEITHECVIVRRL